MFTYFDLNSETAPPPVSEEEYKNIIESFDLDGLDVEGKSKGRAEQGFLRKALFGSKAIGKCGICGKEYPVSFLIAAHIKKRSFCTNEEKLDYKNIVMPMCKFGCDDLFEKGYITVLGGVIEINQKIITEPMKSYLQNIEGKKCDEWNSDTAKYFEWHRTHHKLSMVR